MKNSGNTLTAVRYTDGTESLQFNNENFDHTKELQLTAIEENVSNEDLEILINCSMEEIHERIGKIFEKNYCLEDYKVAS